MIMNQVFYKSVLMGADKISDLELEYLGIDIRQVANLAGTL